MSSPPLSRGAARAVALGAICGALLTLIACHTEPDGERLLEPLEAPARALPGERGAFGVERHTRELRVRIDQRLQSDLFVPLDARGERVAGPVAVIVQGGLVPARRYQWIATHLASRGFVVILPEHALELAFFEQGNGVAALEALRQDAELGPLLRRSPRGAVLGHSLGGVVASRAFYEHPEHFARLVLMASTPAPAADFASRRTPHDARDVVISIASAEDGRIAPDAITRGAETLAAAGLPTYGLLIEGMIHMQWTSDYTAEEEENDGQKTISDEEAFARARYTLDVALDPILSPEATDSLSTSDSWPEGITPLPGHDEAQVLAGGAP